MRNLTISINIEYKRNRTWGWNPTATVTAVLYGGLPRMRGDDPVRVKSPYSAELFAPHARG